MLFLIYMHHTYILFRKLQNKQQRTQQFNYSYHSNIYDLIKNLKIKDSLIFSSKNHYLAIVPILSHIEFLFIDPFIFRFNFFALKSFTPKLNFNKRKHNYGNYAKIELNLLLLLYSRNFYVIFVKSFFQVFCFYFFVQVQQIMNLFEICQFYYFQHYKLF